MKKNPIHLISYLLITFLILSCSKEDNPVGINSITLFSSTSTAQVGATITFTVKSETNLDITSNSTILINDIPIESNIFTPTEAGSYIIKATYSHNNTLLESNTRTIVVNASPTEVTLFNKIVFYDGYATTVNHPVPDGIIRKSNASYVTKLTEEHIASISNKLKIQVTIGALCDNYDRIGGVFINMVNKGTPFSVANVQKRIEAGRFITPFMNKNISPTEVQYLFNTDNIALILNDPAINDAYDIWMELNVFGVPYAANTQVAGCSGRNDVFEGTLKLLSTQQNYTHTNQLLTPIVTYSEMNNYQTGATDIIGQTVRSFNINLSSSVSNAKLYVTTSNHGANSGGEEYNRRQHFIYFDNQLVSTYTPGGKSCEPYRPFNTQANGIYGNTPMTLEEWASFSNWCPGDIIPIRVFALGNLTSGSHSFKIEVPSAQFVNQEGYFPISAYVQGDL